MNRKFIVKIVFGIIWFVGLFIFGYRYGGIYFNRDIYPWGAAIEMAAYGIVPICWYKMFDSFDKSL